MESKPTYFPGIEPDLPTGQKSDETFEKVISLIDTDSVINLVDFACGYCVFAIDGLLQYIPETQLSNIHYIGVDIDKDIIDNASNYLTEYGFQPPKIRKTPTLHLLRDEYLDIPDDTIDYVVITRSLHDLRLQGIVSALIESLRILKPGGMLIFYDKAAKSENFEVRYVIWDPEDYDHLAELLPQLKIDHSITRPKCKDRFEIITCFSKEKDAHFSTDIVRKAILEVFRHKRSRVAARIAEFEAMESDLGGLSPDARAECRNLQAQYYAITQDLSGFPIIKRDFRILGREDDLGELLTFVSKYTDQRAFLMTGEGGIGKTTLLNLLAGVVANDPRLGWIVQADAQELDAVWRIAHRIAYSVEDTLGLKPDDLSNLEQSREQEANEYRGGQDMAEGNDFIHNQPQVQQDNNLKLNLDMPVQSSGAERVRKREQTIDAAVSYVRECSQNGQVGVLLIDTAEAAGDGFCDALNAFLRRIGPANVAIVIAGRRIHTSLPLPVYQRNLDVLPEQAAHDLLILRSHGTKSNLRNNKSLRNAVIKGLGGHPEFLSIASTVLAREPSMDAGTFEAAGLEMTREELITQFLIPRYVRRIARDLGLEQLGGTDTQELMFWLAELALARWFDSSTAKALKHLEAFNVLKAMRDDIIVPVRIGDRSALRFTDRVRDLLRAEAMHTDPERTTQAHFKLAQWAMSQLEGNDLHASLILAHQYHLFNCMPSIAQQYFERTFRIGSDSYDITWCRMLLENLAEIQFPLNRILMWIRLRHADYYRLIRDYEQAEELYFKTIKELVDYDDAHGELMCSLLNNFAIALIWQKSGAKQIRLGMNALNWSLELARSERRPWFRALGWGVYGVACAHLAEYEQDNQQRKDQRQAAIQSYRHSARVCREQITRLKSEKSKNLPDSEFWIGRYMLTHGKALQNLASQYQEMGRFGLAARTYGMAIRKYQQIGNQYQAIEALNMLTQVRPDIVGTLEERDKLDKLSIAVYQERGDLAREAFHLRSMAQRALEAGQEKDWINLVYKAIDLSLRLLHLRDMHVQLVWSAIKDIVSIAGYKNKAMAMRLAEGLLAAVEKGFLTSNVQILLKLLNILVKQVSRADENSKPDSLFKAIQDEINEKSAVHG